MKTERPVQERRGNEVPLTFGCVWLAVAGACIAGIHLPVRAAETWRPARALAAEPHAAPVMTRVVSADPRRLELAYRLPSLTLTPETTTAKGASPRMRAVLGNTPVMSGTGKPMVPFVPVTVLLPAGYTVARVQVEPGVVRTAPGTHLLAHGQTVYPLSKPALAKPAAPDAAVYASDNAYPGRTHDIVGVYWKRGAAILYVNVYPVQYHPRSGRVISWEDFTVRVSTKPADPSAVRYRRDPELPVETLVENPETIATYTTASAHTLSGVQGICDPTDSFTYVIISSAAMRDATTDYTLRDLIAHRRARGVSATIVTLEDIYANYSGDNAAKVREFIKDAYNNWETDYVLLAGDINIIPLKKLYVDSKAGYTDYIPTDLYYQCLDGNGPDGDIVAEVYIGRASAETPAEMANWVYKTLCYERDMNETGYKTGNLMVGEHLGFGGESEYAKPSMEEIRLGTSKHGYTTRGFTNAPKWRTETLYEMDGSWSGSTLKSKFHGNHLSTINHLGHCNYTYCMKLYNSDFDSLMNTNFMFGYSQGCMPGGYDTDCAAEHATTSTRYGFFAVVWNSRYGWGEYNSTDGPSQRFHRPFWHGYFAMDYVTLGAMNCYSHEYNIPKIEQECMRWCYYESNLLGDPMTALPWPYRPPDSIAPALLTVRPPDWTITGRTVPMSIIATDNLAVASVMVNGNPATGSGSNWAYTATLTPWTNTMQVIARDQSANAATQIVRYIFIPDTTRPVITSIQPPSGYSTSAATVPMMISVTDNVTVASVTVNGALAPFTGGTWNYTLPVLFGMNVAVVVAADAEQNTVTQTVFYTRLDIDSPVIGAVNPPSGFTTTNYSVAMTITASDNAGVTAVSVDGAPAAFLGGEQWGYTATLNVGSNTCVIIARDADMNAATAAVHYINTHTPLHYVSPQGGHVYPYITWETAARDIQTALDTADPGDTVIVGDGAYTTQTVNVNKPVTVRSLNGAAHAVISGLGARRCVTMSSPDAVLEGFTLTNGMAAAGGGLHLSAGTVRKCVITGNRAATAGGGAVLAGGLLERCVVRGNAALDGAGIDCVGGVIDACRILQNVSENYGGGVRFNQGGTLLNSLVCQNTANFGGGAYCYYGGTLTNCTVANNTAAAGGGVRCHTGGAFHNTIIYHNTGGNISYNSGASFSFSCTTPAEQGPGNIAADPLFINAAAGDYALDGASPCVNAGSNAAWMATAQDVAGNPRIIGGSGMKIVDMGAFECTNVPDESVHYVSPYGAHIWPYISWATAATNIQDAINEALPSELVLVTDGVYYVGAELVITTDITVASVNGANTTVINARGARRCVRITAGELSGFTLTNGTATRGGALLVEHASVRDCVIAGASATEAGGGVYATGGALRNCTIAGNSALEAGGVFAANAARVVGCRITANTATLSGGGAVSSNHAQLIACRIHGNTASIAGGGIMAVAGSVVSGTVVFANTAPLGGGIHAAAPVRISASVITGNTAQTAAGVYLQHGAALDCSVIAANFASADAGGIYVISGTVACCSIISNQAYNGGGARLDGGQIANSIFIGNRANNYGGGVHLYFAGAVLNTLLARNHAAFGGGAYCYYGGTLTNCTVTANSASSAAGIRCNGGGIVNNCISYHNNGANYVVSGSGYGFSYSCITPQLAGTGNITNDPSFVNHAGGDYRLTPASPCVNAGQTAAWMAQAVDLAGVRRVVGPAVDIGAYEEAASLPFVDITNQTATVEYDVAVYAIGGTNNANAVGSMRWNNSRTGSSGALPAALTWVMPNIPLGAGENIIVVTVTNAAGDEASDSVIITRTGSTAPHVDIITPDAVVPYEISAFTISGTNNVYVVGAMTWVNNLGGFGTFPAALTWAISNVPLAVGVNEITVSGTNHHGTAASDVVRITRQPPDVGIPFVDITNMPMVVPHTSTTATIGGTNNLHVVGTMWWSNNRGGSGTFAAQPSWGITGIPLAPGNNLITVSGTNAIGVMASDMLVITREQQVAGPPFVDIITPDTTVSNDVSTFTIHGTNNAWVTGAMDWECYAGATLVDAGSIPAQPAWTISNIRITTGVNEILVWGTNAAGVEAWDTVLITRLPGPSPQVERFTIRLAEDGQTPILSWSNAAATVLVCTTLYYTTNTAAWFVRAQHVLPPWQDSAATSSPAVYYRIATAIATSTYDLGKLTLMIRQGTGTLDAHNWVSSPFDFVDANGNIVPALAFDLLGVASAVNNEARFPTLRDMIVSQNEVGGELMYAARGNGVWHTTSPMATNWFRNRMYKIIINKTHRGAPRPLTLIGRVPDAQQVYVAAIRQSDGLVNQQNWVAAWFPWVNSVEHSGLADVVNNRAGSPANRDALYSQSGIGGSTIYASRGMEQWVTSTPAATNLYPGRGYIILIKRVHTGPAREWYQPRIIP